MRGFEKNKPGREGPKDKGGGSQTNLAKGVS